MAVGAVLVRILCVALSSIVPKVSAHVAAVSHARVGVEVGREGNLLMRRDGEEAQASQTDVSDASNMNRATHQRPARGQVAADAKEAFDTPSKIDDSALALWSPRMPAFIEKYPEFYGVFFACSGLAVLGLVWFHIYREDLQVEESRQRRAIADARQMVAKAAAYNQKRAAAFAPPTPSTTSTKGKDILAQASTTRSRPIIAVSKAVLTPGKGKGKSPPGESIRLPKFITAHPQESASEVDKGGQTKSIPGENMKLPKFLASHAQESTSASGNTSPRSAPSVASQSTGPQYSTIRNGTVLMARTPVCIFDKSAMHQIGYLHTGQQVVAAGAPEMLDDYTMVPIKPKGAVDLKVMEIVHE